MSGVKVYKVASAVVSMRRREVKNGSSRETGVDSTVMDPTVLIERGSVATTVCSGWRSERRRELLTHFFLSFDFYSFMNWLNDIPLYFVIFSFFYIWM